VGEEGAGAGAEEDVTKNRSALAITVAWSSSSDRRTDTASCGDLLERTMAEPRPMSFLGQLVAYFLRLILHIFFRDTSCSNIHKVPQNAAVIFVCAPHANQVRYCTAGLACVALSVAV